VQLHSVSFLWRVPRAAALLAGLQCSALHCAAALGAGTQESGTTNSQEGR
jgi:hypothetical protein